MIRDLDRLTASTFDVLVVGGGIYGLTIAYDAAQRGLNVALIERDDFGSGAHTWTRAGTVYGSSLRRQCTMSSAASAAAPLLSTTKACASRSSICCFNVRVP